MHGHIIEAEHLARYAWASQFVGGRKVLDAACGTAYGTAMLAAAGASEVVGVDVAEDVVERARASAPPATRFEIADLYHLPFANGEFDLVVCFEAIEHVDDPGAALDELRRMLGPDGLLIVSTPNRDVYTPGNSFHLRELTPNELEAELSSRFRSTALRRQHSWVASGIFDDEGFRVRDNGQIVDIEVRKACEDEPGRETYTIGLASDGELPFGRGVVDLTSDIDIRDWSSRIEAAELAMLTVPGGEGANEAEVTLLRSEIEELRRQLVEGEEALAWMKEVEERLSSANGALHSFEQLRKEHAEMASSSSWRLTRPLRALGAKLRGRRQ